jgi:hypothetical protein
MGEAAPRPATPRQTYQLNMIKCMRKVEPGDGDILTFAEADALLAETARQGLWTPRRPVQRTDSDVGTRG